MNDVEFQKIKDSLNEQMQLHYDRVESSVKYGMWYIIILTLIIGIIKTTNL